MLYLDFKCLVFVHKTSNDIDFIFQESTRPTKKVKHFHQKFQRGLKVQLFRNSFQTHHVAELFNNFNNTDKKRSTSAIIRLTTSISYSIISIIPTKRSKSAIIKLTTSMSWESFSLNLTVTASVTLITGRTLDTIINNYSLYNR